MSNEKPKDILSRHYAGVWNAGELNKVMAAIDETVAPNYQDYNPIPGQAAGREGLKQAAEMLHTAFPDLQIKVDVLLEDGDKATGRWTMRGTHNGPLAMVNLPPTGKKIELTGMDIVRVADGKIVEWWHQEDIMAMMTQLGVIPMPGQAPA
jgi:steroid delta-isomerase-like uncharacterized protein